jgi:mannose-6-phosphate isomerase-like protein (cupin superfamily)
MEKFMFYIMLTAIIAGCSNDNKDGEEGSKERSVSSGKSSADSMKEDQHIVYKSGDAAGWPKEQDAVIAAPKNHKIVLENDRVRVLEVTVSPGEKEPLHHHQRPSVLYVMQSGDFIDYDAGGKVTFDSRQVKPSLVYPLAMWKEPEAPHSIENLSKSVTVKLIRIELKN